MTAHPDRSSSIAMGPPVWSPLVQALRQPLRAVDDVLAHQPRELLHVTIRELASAREQFPPPLRPYERGQWFSVRSPRYRDPGVGSASNPRGRLQRGTSTYSTINPTCTSAVFRTRDRQ
jgi:hypothetical protein